MTAAAALRFSQKTEKTPMAKAEYSSVDHYIASQPPGMQDALKLVRAAIREALPGADEAISYQMPAYRLRGKAVIYFAGWKQHYSLYPITARLADEFKSHLAAYELSGRGTLRIPLDQPLPAKLVARIAKFRAQEVAKVAVSNKAKTKK